MKEKYTNNKARAEAERIIEMYLPYTEKIEVVETTFTKAVIDSEETLYRAKQCALIHVNGILTVINQYRSSKKIEIYRQFWHDVKKEIWNL